MARIQADKLAAAQRQIDAAIRMLLNDEDVIACATLAGAGYRLLRDLADHSAKSPTHIILKSIIRPGMEREFWRVMNSVPNFLKHADKDPDAVLDVDDQWVDLTLFQASLIFRDFGQTLTPEMLTIVTLVLLTHPNLMQFPEGALKGLSAARADLADLSRPEKLALARDALRIWSKLSAD